MLPCKIIFLRSSNGNLTKSGIKFISTKSLHNFDVDYYCDENKTKEIQENINKRKGVGDIEKVQNLYKLVRATDISSLSYNSLKNTLYEELRKLPNKTHPEVVEYGDLPHLVQEINKKRDFGRHKPLEFSEITKRLNFMRTDKLGQTCGHKSYYFLGPLAELEEALLKYTVTKLLNENFTLISVPDILPAQVLESCGMTVNSDRTQIYSLDQDHHGPDLCLSGTAEMSLAGQLLNTVHNANDLPLKFAAVSRCYRAETSNIIEERGIYRVHQFTKVEMFIVSKPENSDEMLEYIRNVQEELFTPMGFNMRVLDMPPFELGAPAYRKYDIEAWMPGRENFGEISSCSNCTDFQSRRLNIQYNYNGSLQFVHTLNGTACAVPRMLIALLEHHQDSKGKIMIPEVLQPYMGRVEYIGRNTNVPELKLLKSNKLK